jgi:hypothetical protein
LEVSGSANEQGQLIANDIRFDEDDLRTAQALEARVDPVETLAKENQARIAATEEETKRLAREAEENAAATRKAREKAEEALKSATIANNRINGLDDFDPVRTITVLFAPGSASLGPMDERRSIPERRGPRPRIRKAGSLQLLDSPTPLAKQKRIAD